MKKKKEGKKIDKHRVRKIITIVISNKLINKTYLNDALYLNLRKNVLVVITLAYNLNTKKN